MLGKVHSPGFLALVNAAKAHVREIDIESYKEMVATGEPHRLVDVREDGEWAAGHASGATHLSKGILERDLESTFPDTSERLVFYCGGGFRSALATEAAQKMGYTNVISLDGGWRAIQSSGLPLSEPGMDRTEHG